MTIRSERETLLADLAPRATDPRPWSEEDELDTRDTLQLVTAIDVDRELASRSLREFVEMAWPLVEPVRPFVPNWHIDAVCEHLQAVTEGDITRLLINVPPGTAKSLLACVFWPAWVWTKFPGYRWIFASYHPRLSTRDGNKHKRIVQSRWYRERWGHIVRPRKSEWSAVKFATTANGFRINTSVSGYATGDHADCQVADDPLKPKDVTGKKALSRTALESCATWWQETMPTRLVDFEKSARVIIMQRLHDADLAGVVLAEGGYTHLMLPMEFDPKRKCTIPITGFSDPRTTKGELLFPARFGEAALTRTKRELGVRGYEAQMQQNPSPASGSIFMRDKFKRYRSLPDLRTAIKIQTWDCAFKGLDTSDPVAGFVLALLGVDIYVVARVHGQLTFSQTLEAIRRMVVAFPDAMPILIEDKANGPAIIDVLKQEIMGLLAIDPQGGKESRANAIEPIVSAGNLWLPEGAWGDEVIDEMVRFPVGVHDDQVDALSQGLAYLQSKSVAAYVAAMEALRK